MSMDRAVHNRHRVLNLVQTILLAGGSLALFMATAYVFFGPQGVVFAIIFGAVSLYTASQVSPAMVLRMYRAQPVSRHQFAAGHDLLETLSLRAGLAAKPKLYVIPSDLMNAFAVGRVHDSAICLTDKLIRSLTLRELAAVMAHEISHIVNADIRVMAIADMVSRFTSFLSTFGIVTLLLNLPSVIQGGTEQVPWGAVLLLLFAPTIGALLQLGLSRTREYDADFGAVMLTGDPDALASALLKLETAQKAHWEGMVLPGGRIPDPSLLRSHPRTADRIARLMAMKQTAPAGSPLARPALAKPARKGVSPVPVIARNHGLDEEGGEEMASGQSLYPPQGRPRIHLRRGGVYW
jgi:heat shock protein HtpX